MTGSVAYANVTTTEAHVQQPAQPSVSAQWEGGLSPFGLNQWQSEAIKGVYKIRALQPDWDGEGGQPPSSDVARTALAIISYLSSEDLRPPFVAPTPCGGISFEWVEENREVEIEILPDSHLLFLKVENGEPVEEGEIDILDITHLFKWLRNEPETSVSRNLFLSMSMLSQGLSR